MFSSRRTLIFCLGNDVAASLVSDMENSGTALTPREALVQEPRRAQTRAASSTSQYRGSGVKYSPEAHWRNLNRRVSWARLPLRSVADGFPPAIPALPPPSTRLDAPLDRRSGVRASPEPGV